MESKRQNRISKLLLQDLSEIIRLESRALFHGAMITVTKVGISPDLSLAKVYVSIFATKNTDRVLDLLQENKKKIRFLLGNIAKHQLRVIPDLKFYLDDSLDYIDNIDQLLKK